MTRNLWGLQAHRECGINVGAIPIPRVEDLFATEAGGKFFTKLDMSHAYQQIELDDASKQYVVINTHKGLFRYNRLPFGGVSSAPAILQRVMESLLQGIPGVGVYLDDILVSGTEKAHLEVLEQVLDRLEESGLRLNRCKCVFMTDSVAYLGTSWMPKACILIQTKSEQW